ncbi:MAG: roadblock/LC7 domain-containing protein [Planctomycetes bacterium]|jgi:predicted regulator of Ras-like GTPase activity (Roadblock/LC7/MglB family)|nr:roadblock/LC7 domain-containing protein [Planctomycetota bacterium]HNZ66036.1 roadblock/LC7 domain-containing protein [Planctomycetota bacterium]HON46082.1 roadblock/LC7 domain-containing protein [Planctomycetota bacterium]HPY74328.1 roadblock/LC7 domain-containing protein [Planctomycetota bacterium]HQA99906.1 roadblock/LC7 domain-containing protein [Planctomycetota bacterium]
MLKVLKRLNREVGVKGSMVVSPDGLVVMSELGEGFNENVVAAMASSTINATKKALEYLGCHRFDRIILNSVHGRIVFVDIELACLLVLTDKNINIDFTLLEIDGAAHRIKNLWKLD